jgi:hypothetical protein
MRLSDCDIFVCVCEGGGVVVLKHGRPFLHRHSVALTAVAALERKCSSSYSVAWLESEIGMATQGGH